MAFLRFFGVSADELMGGKYTIAVLTFIVFFLGAKIITWVTEKFILKLTSKTKTEVDDLLVRKTNKPISFMLLLIGFKLAIVPLELQNGLNEALQHIITTLLLFVLVYVFVSIFDIAMTSWVHSRATKKALEPDENLIKVSSKIFRVILFVAALFIVLSIWSVQVGPLLASLGIIGIAVAFGLQNTLGNVFGGFSLLIDRSIKVGDIVKIDEDTTGTVIDVGLRATKIRTWDNEVIIIPNGKLAGSNIKNYVLPNPIARIVIPFSVVYGSNVDIVKKIVMGEINKLDNLDKTHDAMVMFLEMGSSSLNFKAFVWLKSYKDRFGTKEKLNCMIYNALNKNNITIPFPQLDVWVKDFQKRAPEKSKAGKGNNAKRKVVKTGETPE